MSESGVKERRGREREREVGLGEAGSEGGREGGRREGGGRGEREGEGEVSGGRGVRWGARRQCEGRKGRWFRSLHSQSSYTMPWSPCGLYRGPPTDSDDGMGGGAGASELECERDGALAPAESP